MYTTDVHLPQLSISVLCWSDRCFDSPLFVLAPPPLLILLDQSYLGEQCRCAGVMASIYEIP